LLALNKKMKSLHKVSVILLVAGYYFGKLVDGVLRPLKDMPEPDFNNVYDSSML